jgi:hypothetical protein
MKFHSLLFLAGIGTSVAVLADVPQKVQPNKYAMLWTNSPFTSPPPPPPPEEESNPLDDYVLLGVSPIANGYRVTMLNRKTPDQRITVEPGNEKYQVVSVTRRRGDPLGTVVRMSAGTKQGDVTFDENLLTLTPPPAAPQQQQQQQPGQQQRGQPQVVPGAPGQPNPVQGRPRVMPPGAPGAPAAIQRQPGQRPTTTGGPSRGSDRGSDRGGDRGNSRRGR